MAKVLVSDINLSNIADAIRSKNGTTKSYKVAEMATAIGGISVGGGTSEDLSSELSTQNSLITTQETTIDNIISALEGKAAGGGSDSNIQTVDLTLRNQNPGTTIYTYACTTYNFNQYGTFYRSSRSGYQMNETISDVVVGSTFVIACSDNDMMHTEDGIEIVFENSICIIGRVTATSGTASLRLG